MATCSPLLCPLTDPATPLSTRRNRNGYLYTLNFQCPEERWPQQQALLRRCAETFQLVNSGAAAAAFPSRL